MSMTIISSTKLCLENIQKCKRRTRKSTFIAVLLAIVLAAILAIILAVALPEQSKSSEMQPSQLTQGIGNLNQVVGCRFGKY